MPPALDYYKCRFGQWLASDAQNHRATQDVFQSVDGLHRKVHTVAAELCALHGQGKTAEALARRAELEDLRNALIEQLKGLAQETRQ